MIKFVRPVILAIVFYAFVLLQASFLPHFAIAGQSPNLVFILFFILVFLNEDYLFFLVAIAGFFLDIFFFPHMGITLFVLYAIWGLQKANRHFFKKSQEDYLVLNFLASFTAAFLFYNIVLVFLSFVFHFPFSFSWTFLIGLAYNLIFAAIGFLLFKNFSLKKGDRNQLKLF